MFADIPYEEWSNAFEHTVDELLWEAGIGEPPVDAFLVAMRLGLIVTEDLALESRARMVRLDQGESHEPAQPATAIVLGEEQRFERRQFAVAHELGEFAAMRVFDRLAVDPRHAPYGTREQVANVLAARLLLPARWFRKHALACDWDLPLLKDTFWTASHELIARRMLDMSPPVVITVFDQGHQTWRRSNFRPHIGGLLEVEHRCWQQCYQTSEGTRGEQPPGTFVRCWPIHEPDWRREIIRTDFEHWE